MLLRLSQPRPNDLLAGKITNLAWTPCLIWWVGAGSGCLWSCAPSILRAVLKFATIVLKVRAADSAKVPRLVEILFGAYRRQILGLLLLRSDVTFYVREIAHLTGVPAGSLHRELKLL